MITSMDVIVALAKLKPREREALIDTVVVGRSHPEIAASMGVTRQAVAQMCKRARRQMRRELEAK